MRYLVFTIVLLSYFSIAAQSYIAEHTSTFPFKAEKFVGADKFTNLYYINDQTLYKSGLDQEYEFAALNLGKITHVDLLNPLKITVFYKQSNTVVILDNTLNEITRVEFSTIEDFRNVSMATTANDRRLWIFNSDLQQLELFDYRINKVIVEFPPLEEIPNAYASDFNFCWLQTDTSFLAYNIYGTLIAQEIQKTQYDYMSQNQEIIIASKGNELFIKTNMQDAFTNLDIHQNSVQEFSLIGEILYIYNGQNLMAYTIKPN